MSAGARLKAEDELVPNSLPCSTAKATEGWSRCTSIALENARLYTGCGNSKKARQRY
jgi:hypothetical protein